MLRENDVNRIIIEEQLRWSIRRELEASEKKKAPTSNLWEFLNSALGLLIISSVVIAGLGRLYNEHQKTAQEDLKQRTEVLKLTSEIDNRITRLMSLKKDLEAPSLSPRDRQSKSIYIWRIVVGDPFYNPPLPEFRNTHFSGLLLSLRLNGGATSDLKLANAAAVGIEDDARRLHYSFVAHDIEANMRTLALFNSTLAHQTALSASTNWPTLAFFAGMLSASLLGVLAVGLHSRGRTHL